MATKGTLAAGWGDGRGGRGALRRRIAAGAAALGCAAALTFGAAGVAGSAPLQPVEQMMHTPERPCPYGDVHGVAGEGCGVARPSPTSAASEERPCVYADVRGVPGEGCRPAAGADTAR